MDSYVLFRNNKRVNVNEDDLCCAKISRIFQVSTEALYLTDDTNRAVFPNDAGEFNVSRLLPGGHYEVHGDTDNDRAQGPSVGVAGNMNVMSAQAHPTPFAFAQRSVGPVCPQNRRASSGPKTFQRSVQLVEPSGNTLLPVQTLYLKLTEPEANVPSVAQKIQEQLDSEEGVVLTDSKGQELIDVTGTQGLDFWKSQTRKVFCMTDSRYRQYLAGRRNKQRKSDNHTAVCSATNDNATLLQELTDDVLDKTRQVGRELDRQLQALTSMTTDHVLLPVARSQQKALQDAFACIICKGSMEQPLFATCCKSLLACKACADRWFDAHTSCPKCRTDDAAAMCVRASGLQEVIEILLPVIQP